jgi:hypothetical protein
MWLIAILTLISPVQWEFASWDSRIMAVYLQPLKPLSIFHLDGRYPSKYPCPERALQLDIPHELITIF